MEEQTHHCYSGRVFKDPANRSLGMMPCPICMKERTKEVRDGIVNEDTGKRESLSEKLGVGKRFTTDVYTDEYIIGKVDMHYLDKESLYDFNNRIDRLTSNLIMSETPKTSMVLYLGRHAKLQEFAYILLASAYKGLLSVSKILTPREITLNKYKEEFDENYKTDIAVVINTDSSDVHALSEIQGFMQERAYNDKPTIVLLSNRRNFTATIGRLCSLDEPRMDLGAYLGVNYRKNIDMSEESVKIAMKAIQVSNDSLETNQVLEDRYKTINTETNNNKAQQEADMKSFDINKYTGGSFNGRV